MTKAQSKSYNGVKKKLMGAVCMLLVASIMVVSSTYAWFTLSTAPEITGITTSVGANGNLEVALLTTETFNSPDLITSSVGDSLDVAGQTAVKANTTWGNLINLSDSSYGLDTIVLYPAALNLEGGKVADSPLQTPTYGSDGRVSGTNANTASAVHGEEGWKIYYGNQDYGVRAVGTADGLSERQVALNSAKKLFNSYMNGASSKVTQAIANNAMGLLALQGSESTVVSAENGKSIYNLTTAVNSAVSDIANAYRQALIAAAAASSAVTDEEFKTAQTLITQTGFSKLASLSSLTFMPSAVSGNIGKVSQMVTDAAEAVSEVQALQNDLTGTVADYKTAAGKIVDTSLLNGDQSKMEEGFTIENTEAKTCILGDIADFTDTYTATVAGGISKLIVKQHTDKATDVKTTVSEYSAANSTSEAGQLLNDMYGYIIDFAFRTNAASSNLQLQTDGVNRVYSDASGDDLAAQGAGSYLSFAAAGMTDEQVHSVMSAVRVVFFNPDDGSYYAEAAVNTEKFKNENGTIKAPLYLIDKITAVKTMTTVLGRDAYSSVDPDNGTGDYVLDNAKYPEGTTLINDSGVKVTTKYTNYAPTITAAAWRALTAKTITYTVTSEEYDLLDDESAITSLTQNQAMKVSALVFIDGNLVDNGDTVNAATAGAMKLNLQFSSSADLVPMGNSSLKDMTTSDIDNGSMSIELSDEKTSASIKWANESGNENVISTEWMSTNPAVAAIDENGTITRGENGQANLVAIVKTDRNVYTATKEIIVTTPSTGAAIVLKDGQEAGGEITLATERTASYDTTATLSLKLNPDNTTDVLDETKGVTWSVPENTTEVEIDAKTGVLTAKSVTTTPVTVTATYYVEGEENGKTAAVGVNVVTALSSVETKDKATDGSAITELILKRETAQAASGSFYLSIPEKNDITDTIKSVKTYFANDALADSSVTVDGAGTAVITVTAKTPTNPGRTTLLAVITTNNGALIFQTYVVEVQINAFGEGDLELKAESSGTLTTIGATAKLTLAKATTVDEKCDDRVKAVTWTSSDPTIATVTGTNDDATVTVVADSTGEAAVGKTVTITAKIMTFGGAEFTKTATVSVSIPAKTGT